MTPCNNCNQAPCKPPCNQGGCNCNQGGCNNCCNSCNQPVEIVTTVEIVESCPLYEEIIINDEPQIIERNHTIRSTYNLTANDLLEAQLQQNDEYQDESRHKLCGNGGLLSGIKHDEENVQTNNTNTSLESNNERKKHNIITNIVNNHIKPVERPCTITSGWNCRNHGIKNTYSHPTNCQKYIECSFCGSNEVYTCPYDESFDGRRCSSDWSHCNQLKQCQYDRELLHDPWNSSNYFICVRKRGFHNKYFTFRRRCPDDHEFDVVKQQCFRIKVIISIVKPKPPCKRGCGYNDEPVSEN